MLGTICILIAFTLGTLVRGTVLASARNRVTRAMTRTNRAESTWDSLANEAGTIGDTDQTTCLPVWRA